MIRLIKGDLVQLSLDGNIDTIVHGCNCLCQMGRGIAKTIAETFPEAKAADQATVPRDRSKLGTYSVGYHTHNGHKISIVNAYTQFDRRSDDPKTVLVDYDAVRSCLQSVAKQFGTTRIGLPLIGAKLAGGDWSIIERILVDELEHCDVTVVHYAFDFDRTFQEFIDQSRYLSNAAAALTTPAGQKLLTVGHDVVREIFVRNIELNAHTMMLLTTISTANPIPSEDAGNIAAMAHHWVAWGKENGFC